MSEITQSKNIEKRRRWLLVSGFVCAIMMVCIGLVSQAGATQAAVKIVPTIPPPPSCTNPTIRTVGSGDWENASTWSPSRVPNSSDTVLVEAAHTVDNARYINIASLCNNGQLRSRAGNWLYARATNFVENNGTIIGQNGFSSSYCGRGSNIYFRSAEIRNNGTIIAGDGTDGTRCGGRGGHIYLFYNRYQDGVDIINNGLLRAGHGGSVTGTSRGWGGWGGSVVMFAGWYGTIWDSGVQLAGNGGHGNPLANYPQRGGDGGCNRMWAGRIYLTGVNMRAGWPGIGANGGRNGRRGCIRIDPPNEIVISGANTSIEGGDIEIFGGEDWDLTLTNLPTNAISSTGTIKLAVGPGGTIDLSNNAIGSIAATGAVTVSADTITLSTGTTLANVISAATITQLPGQVQYGAELSGPGQLIGDPQSNVGLDISIMNASLVTDTYNITVDASVPWSKTALPSTVTLGPLQALEDVITVTVPAATHVAQTGVFTVTAQSQADSTRTQQITIDVIVEGPVSTVFVPVMFRD